MKTLNKIISLLTPNEQRKAVLLFFMILVMALLDMMGVASILPFMTVLVNPEIIETNIKKTNIPRPNKNSWLFSIPNIFDA